MKNIKKEDEDILLRAERIAKQVLSIIRNKKEETSAIDFELKNNPHFKSYVDKFYDEQIIKTICKNYDRKEKISETARFNATILKQKQISHRRTIVACFSVAAALIAVSFLVFNQNSKKQDVVATQNNIIIKPTFISECGDKIELQNNSVNIASDIKIDYNKTSGNLQSFQANKSLTELEYSKIIIPSKYTYTVVLSDGSKVMLNANSSLSFPKEFDTTNRTVHLEGEAYFEVTKSDIPFYVNCRDAKIRVYGTQFNVKSYTNTRLVLLEGSVGVTVIDSNNEVMMLPSQCLTVNGDSLEIQDVNVNKYIGWKNDCFIAELDTITELLSDISQWYGIQFNYAKGVDLNKKVSVQIDRNMDIDQLMEAICPVLKIKFIKERSGAYFIDSN